MWHSNPAYGATLFNATAGAKRTQDYLSKIERCGTTTRDDPAAEDDPGEADFGGVAGTSGTADLLHQSEVPMDGVEEEGERFGEKDGGGGAEASGRAEDQHVNVPQPVDLDLMSVDEEPMVEACGPAWQTQQVSHLPHPQFRN